MKFLFLFVPVAILLELFAPEQHVWVFLTAGLAILPAAGMLGHATEKLAERTGEGVGGLLNATFGNAAELILALAALRAGMPDVVKASLAGSIIGNILLVLGAAMFAGGLRHHEQKYNAIAAKSQATMLVLATIALILPAAFRAAAAKGGTPAPVELSAWIAGLLLFGYVLNLVYALRTHRELFAGDAEAGAAEPAHHGSMRRPLLELLGATVLIAVLSEILVGAVRPAAAELGISQVFVGVFVVALLGNAAEHATAVTAAMKNRMDLALSIAVGSSVQIALFVAPLLVLVSWFVGPAPIDLDFGPGLVLTVVLSVVITAQVAGDGRSDWLRGVQLLMVYLILAVVFLFIPGS